MKRNWFKEIFFPIIVNDNTGECHEVRYITDKCSVAAMRYGRYTTRRRARKLFGQLTERSERNRYNGCKYCWPEAHND